MRASQSSSGLLSGVSRISRRVSQSWTNPVFSLGSGRATPLAHWEALPCGVGVGGTARVHLVSACGNGAAVAGTGGYSAAGAASVCVGPDVDWFAVGCVPSPQETLSSSSRVRRSAICGWAPVRGRRRGAALGSRGDIGNCSSQLLAGSEQLLGVKRQPHPLPALSGRCGHQRSVPQMALFIVDCPGEP